MKGNRYMTEEEKWQAMMVSCRRACKILSEEFREPEYLNWPLGSRYHDDLWAKVRGMKSKTITEYEREITRAYLRGDNEKAHEIERELYKKYPAHAKGDIPDKENDNPVDLSKIRGELVRLETDLEGKKPYLSEAFRESVEGAISQMKMCNLRGAIDQSEAAQLFANMIQCNEPDSTKRIDNIENQLKDLMVEIAIEACNCKFSQ